MNMLEHSVLEEWGWATELSIIIIVLLVAGFIFARFWNGQVVSRLYQKYPKLYTRIDILRLESIYTHNEWRLTSLLTAIMSLYNRGMVTIRCENKWRHRPASAMDLRFSLLTHRSITLRNDEQYMIEKLFRKEGGTVFAARSLILPDLSNRHLWFRSHYYYSRLNQMFDQLWYWSRHVQMQHGYVESEIYKWRRDGMILMGYTLAFFLYIYGMNDYIPQEADLMQSLVAYWVGLFAVLSLWIFILFCYARILVRHVLSAKLLSWLSHSSTLNGFKKVLAILLVFNLGKRLILEPSTTSMWITALAIVCCIVASYQLPTYFFQLPLNQLKEKLTHGGYQNVKDPHILTWLLEASIVMRCGHEFLAVHPQVEEVAIAHPDCTMLSNAHQMVEVTNLIVTSSIQLEEYEQEYDEYYESGIEDRSMSRAVYMTDE